MIRKSSFDVIVLGAGPGGYVAAIRTSQLGLRTAIVEKENLGGVCLNWGCIPTKALLKVAEYYTFMKEASAWGFQTGKIGFDWQQIIRRSREAAAKLSGGVAALMRKNRITVFQGRGIFLDSHKISVTDSSGKTTDELEAPNIIVATGAHAASLPGIEIDGQRVLSSREAMMLPERPKSMAVIGAGAVGLEFTWFYNAFDTEVTLLEYQPRILPVSDEEVCTALEKAFKKQGVKIFTESKVRSAEPVDAGVRVVFERQGEERVIEVERVLMAAGVRPNIEGMGLREMGVKIDKQGIETDDYCQTNIPGVWAIGDVSGPPALAHAASAEAIVAAEAIANHNPRPIDYSNIPACIYCQPQAASLGMTEAQARQKGYDIAIGRFPFFVNGKSVAAGEKEGFVKIIAEAKHGEILGAHIIGADASELIGELVMAKSNELTVHEVHSTIHAHPTLSEATGEASAVWLGQPIHI